MKIQSITRLDMVRQYNVQNDVVLSLVKTKKKNLGQKDGWVGPRKAGRHGRIPESGTKILMLDNLGFVEIGLPEESLVQ